MKDSAFTEKGKSHMIRKDHQKSFSLLLEGKLSSLEYTPKWPPATHSTVAGVTGCPAEELDM